MKILQLLIITLLSLNIFAQSVSTITTQIKGSGGLSLDQEGNLYISDFGDFLGFSDPDGQPNNILKLDTNQNLSVFSTGFIGASGSSFDNNGVLYQSDIRANSIYKIINGTRTFVTSTGINAPVGIAFDSQDNFYVCNCGNSTIRKVTPTGTSTLFASGSSFFNCPNGMTIDENDNLYIVSFSNTKIVKVTPSGIKTIIGNTLGGNGHVDYDPITKNIYIASFNSQRIYSLNTIDSSATPQVIAGTGLSGNNNGDALNATFRFPNGIAVTKTGDSIYVNTSVDPNQSNLNPQIIRLITGVLSGTASVESISLGYKNLKTYPNPVKNDLTISVAFFKEQQNMSLKIYSILGKEIRLIENLSTDGLLLKTTINLKNLSAGTYFYTLYNNGNKKLFSGKLVKK